LFEVTIQLNVLLHAAETDLTFRWFVLRSMRSV